MRLYFPVIKCPGCGWLLEPLRNAGMKFGMFLCAFFWLASGVAVRGVDESPFLFPPEGNPEQVIGELGCVAPTALAFDSQNRPYLMNQTYRSQYGFIQTLDTNGNWVQRSYLPALQAWNSGAGLPAATATNLHAVGYLAFDAADAMYVVLRTYINASAGPFVLLYSTNLGMSFQVYNLPQPKEVNYVKLEQYTGRNCLPHPPAIGIAQYRAAYTNSDWASYNNFYVLLPAKTAAGLNLGTSILVSTNSNGFVSHSGSSSFAFSESNRVHVAYLNVPAGEPGSYNPTYVATLDRTTRTVIARQHVADALSSDSDKVDVHCCPVIAADQQGFLHVVSGAHNKPFHHTRSLVAGSITNGWTAPLPMNVVQTYATLVCDSGDRLFSIYRTIPPLYFQDREASGSAGWSLPKQLTTMPSAYTSGGGYYTIYYHRLFMDRGDALFASFTFYWVGTGAVVHSAYPRILAISEDGGVTWRACSRQRMFERMVRQPVTWTGPANGSDDWTSGARWSGGAPGWGDTAVFTAAGNYSVSPIRQSGRFPWQAMHFEEGIPAFAVGFSVWNPSAAGTLVQVSPGVTTEHTIDAGRGAGPFQVNLRSGTNTVLNNGSGLLSIGSSQLNGVMRALSGEATLVVDGSGNTVLGGLEGLSSTGRMVLQSAGGTLRLVKRGAGILTLNNTNAHSGTTLEAGTLRVVIDGASGWGGGAFGSAGAPLTLRGGTLDLWMGGIAPCNTIVSGDVTILCGSSTESPGITSGPGTLAIGTNTLTVQPRENVASGGTSLAFGATTLSGDAEFCIHEGPATMNVVLGAVGESGAGRSLSKTGAGTLTLNGAHSYTGGTVVNGGTLACQTNMGANPTEFSGSGTVRLGSAGYSMRLNSNARFGESFTGRLEIAPGATVTAFNSSTFSNSVCELNVASGAYFSMNGAAMRFGGLNGSGIVQNTAGGTYAPAALTIGANNASGSFSGQINSGSPVNGAISLTKIGSGTQILSGVCSYTGPTVISNGTLLVNGSLAAASAVSVEPNAILGGTGAVNGAVTARGGIAPGGDRVGSIATGSQFWREGGRLLCDVASAINSAMRDALVINGTLAFQFDNNGTFTLRLASMSDGATPGAIPDFNPATHYSWPLVTASGGIIGFDPSRFEVDTSAFIDARKGVFRVELIGNTLALIYTPLETPQIHGQSALPNGSFELWFSGPAGQSYRVLATNILTAPVAHWPVLVSGVFGAGGPALTNFADPNAAEATGRRFYRVVSP